MLKLTIVDYINGNEVYFDGRYHFTKTPKGERLVFNYKEYKKYN